MLDPLEQELFNMLVDVCRIQDAPQEMSPDDPIVGPDSPLGLDSLDVVEIVVAIQKKYNVRIENMESSRMVFRSLKTLADHIRKHGG